MPSSERERQHEEDRDQRQPHVADRVRDRPRPQRLAGERLRRRRPGAVEPRQAPERQPRALGGVLHLLAGAVGAAAGGQARVCHRSTAACAAPSSGSARLSCPRRTCASTSPEASERLPTVRRSGQPSSSASANLPPGPDVVAVVVDDVEPGLAQLLVEPLGERALLRALAAEPDEVDVEGRERARPRDPLLVGELLDGGGADARRADAVGAHPDRLLGPGLVEVGRAEHLGVARAELEDVADLDRGLDADRVAVDGVPGLHAPDVAALEGEVAARLDPAQVPPLAVGAGDVRAPVRPRRRAAPARRRRPGPSSRRARCAGRTRPRARAGTPSRARW